ncbi:MAG: putative site-specific recombinase, resolvase family, partial [Flavipsychrobacter sp.]|nr:putative site-specific recombinase, resolvase family [Flavipsychrobacter sp.]
MTNPIKVAIYARVSTARQEEEQTIQSQILQLHDEAKSKNYCIIKEYCDDGWSGDSLERPALDQLRTDAKGKSFEAVLIYDPDRLARRYSYQELLMDELKEAGIAVLFITIAAPVNSEDKILYGVRGLFAEYERAKIKERFRIGKLRKIREGHILTTRPLYGYNYVKKDGQTHGYYTVNEHEANIIRMIFSWVAEDELTIRAVIRKLHVLGIKPRMSTRGVWNTSTLSRLLRHKGYIGLAYYGRTYAVVPDNPLKKGKYRKYKKSSTRVRPESEWLTISIPAIINKTVFEKAARQMDRNFEFSKRNKKFNYLLSHKVWCVCGHRRSASGGTNNYRYYSCNSGIQSFPLPKTCKEKAVNSVAVDNAVWYHLTLLMTS